MGLNGLGRGRRGGGARSWWAWLALSLALLAWLWSVPPAAAQSSALPAFLQNAPRLVLRPASGPPGTPVRVSGLVPGGSAPRGGPPAVLCWGGCTDGLALPVKLTWSATRPGAFQGYFRVPRVPWLGAAGPRPLLTGPYPLSVEPAGSDGPALFGTFRLTGPVPALCQPGAPCARLRLSPATAPPGTLVQVSGWAPLVSAVAVGNNPFTYTLDLVVAGRAGTALPLAPWSGRLTQAPDGALRGRFVVPPPAATGGPATGPYVVALRANTLGTTRLLQPATRILRVTRAPTWAALGALHVLWTAPATVGPTAAAPSDPELTARCLPAGGIALSTDAGRSWEVLPTLAATAVARAAGFVLDGPGMPGARARSPVCATLALAPGHPHTIFAAFVAEQGEAGNVPPYELPMVSHNHGRTWDLLPAPRGSRLWEFSRFQTHGRALQALFWAGPASRTVQDGVEATTNGGRSWGPGRLTCPARGPCLIWGPAPTWTWPGVCNAQALLWSPDRGVTWRRPTWPRAVCYIGTGPSGPYELAATGPHAALLIGDWQFPLLRTVDGGESWSDVALPRLPGAPAPSPTNPPLVPVAIQGDGALLAPWESRWWILPPGAAAWCATAARIPPRGGPRPPVAPLACAQAPPRPHATGQGTTT